MLLTPLNEGATKERYMPPTVDALFFRRSIHLLAQLSATGNVDDFKYDAEEEL